MEFFGGETGFAWYASGSSIFDTIAVHGGTEVEVFRWQIHDSSGDYDGLWGQGSTAMSEDTAIEMELDMSISLSLSPRQSSCLWTPTALLDPHLSEINPRLHNLDTAIKMKLS
ncbi:hypothetical protein L1049_015559 [Liquidambar formosana]|uniref:Uncharacterized protein n=1 Tax=Liquidambar formosana TaxID=63359 RepID=A0AAP0RY30_LIQFO